MMRLGFVGALLFVASVASTQPTIDITRQGYWLCKKADGTESRHVAEPEAFQECTNDAFANPGRPSLIVPAEYRITATLPAPPTVPPVEPPLIFECTQLSLQKRSIKLRESGKVAQLY
jgi:hypothetical protein